MADPAWPPIEKSAVARQAVERIMQLIVSRQFPPGSKLPPERELSGMLGISRSSVREAIRALSHMNILEARHGQGTYVTSLSPELLIEPLHFLLAVDDRTIHQLFEVRKIIETAAAGLAARRAEPAELEQMHDLHRRLQQCVHDAETFVRLDTEMHDLIARSGHNDLLVQLLASTATLLRRSRSRTGAMRWLREQSALDHGDIMEAIAAGDGGRASSAMLMHLEHVEKAFREVATAATEEDSNAVAAGGRPTAGNGREDE